MIRHSVTVATNRRLLLHQTHVCFAFVLAFVLSLSTAYAQFDSGSDGSDGALNLTTPGVVIFDPRDLGLDPNGDNIYHFTTINIAAGVTVRLLGPQLNMSPVFWLASGSVQIAGTIDLNGGDGYSGSPSPAERQPSVPGAGGYPGGVGNFGGSRAQSGTGPGRGAVIFQSGVQFGGDGAGHATKGSGVSGGPIYGNAFLVPLLGGSGGGGGGGIPGGGGGGAGGGALLIASTEAIVLDGTITANGGNGGGPAGTQQLGGGAGSGGSIHLKAPIISGAGTLRALGGTFDHFGGGGRIRLEAFQQNFTGTVNPAPSLATPTTVFLPPNPPSVRVAAISGTDVPTVPTASFQPPDVTVDVATAAMVMVEAQNVPAGTLVQIHVFSENAQDQIVDSSPLVAQPNGVLTATADVVFPIGFSRVFARAKWTNP